MSEFASHRRGAVKCAPAKHGVRTAGALLVALALLAVSSHAALADGGAGGSGDAATSPGGAGGTGFTGNPGQNGSSGGQGGGGGGGGAGGGAGGAGGANLAVGSGTGGSGGGGGVNGNAAGASTISNTSPLAGAAGGGGGNFDPLGGGGGGGGGAGGYGAIVTGSGASSNISSITGGKGGNGGDGIGGGSGGDGGVGVQFTAVGATFTNSGTVAGGNGGTAGSGSVNGNPGAGGAGVVGAGITIVNSGSIAGGLSGDGVTQANAITFTGGANTLTLQNGPSLTGNIDIDGGGSVTFNQSAAQTLSNVIAGNGSIIQAGPGTLTLSGINTYSGATTITGGTLEIDGSIADSASVTVTSGGVLSGTGTVDPATTTIMRGGTLAPGDAANPTGTLTITGSLAFQSGALYLVQVTPSAAASTHVSAAATLTGATVNAQFASGSYLSKQYTILTAAGGLGGTTFAGLTNTNLPSGFIDSLSYGSNDVVLNLTAALPASGLNGNQQTIATTINNFFNSGGALPPGFAALFTLTGAAQTGALTQLDGEDATGAERGAFDLMNEFLDLMLDPYVYGRGGFGSGGQPLDFAPDQVDGLPPEIALAYAGLLKAPSASRGGVGAEFAQHWTAWGAGFGGSAVAEGDPAIGSSNVTTGSYGYATGLDYHYSPDTVAGFSLAGGGTNWNLAQGLGGGRSDAFLAGIYGVTRQGPVYLAAALAFANDWFATNRTAFAGDQLTARFQGQSYSARLEGGYRFAVPASGGGAGWGSIGLTPYVAIQTQEFRTPAYSEDDLTGGGFALSYGAMNGTNTRSELGTRFNDLTALGDMPLVLRAKLAWAHDWVGNAALNASFVSLPGTGFNVVGAAIPQDSALTSLGAQLFVTPHWSLLAKFDGEFASASQVYAGSGTLRYTW